MLIKTHFYQNNTKIDINWTLIVGNILKDKYWKNNNLGVENEWITHAYNPTWMLMLPFRLIVFLKTSFETKKGSNYYHFTYFIIKFYFNNYISFINRCITIN